MRRNKNILTALLYPLIFIAMIHNLACDGIFTGDTWIRYITYVILFISILEFIVWTGLADSEANYFWQVLLKAAAVGLSLLVLYLISGNWFDRFFYPVFLAVVFKALCAGSYNYTKAMIELEGYEREAGSGKKMRETVHDDSVYRGLLLKWMKRFRYLVNFLQVFSFFFFFSVFYGSDKISTVTIILFLVLPVYTLAWSSVIINHLTDAGHSLDGLKVKRQWKKQRSQLFGVFLFIAVFTALILAGNTFPFMPPLLYNLLFFFINNLKDFTQQFMSPQEGFSPFRDLWQGGDFNDENTNRMLNETAQKVGNPSFNWIIAVIIVTVLAIAGIVFIIKSKKIRMPVSLFIRKALRSFLMSFKKLFRNLGKFFSRFALNKDKPGLTFSDNARDEAPSLSKRQIRAMRRIKRRQMTLMLRYFLTLVRYGRKRGIAYAPSFGPYAYVNELSRVLPGVKGDLLEIAALFEEAHFSNRLISQMKRQKFITLVRSVISSPGR
ncbi:MAG: DUF4129 domain-containing protein [Spirochaetales bacterium]|nr:DUF4129 domain-containing protein [Spirochaetales bacterium]